MNGTVTEVSDRRFESRQENNAIAQLADAETQESDNVSEVLREKTSKPEDREIPAEQPSVPDFPNGGLRAWLTVLGGWLVTFVSWGYISSFGVFQTYYELNQLSDQSPSNIAWIGSLQLFFIFFSGIFVGYAFDAGYHTHIVLTGSALLVIGMFTTAECTEIWQFVLAQGVCGGIGCGFLFLPATSVAAHWWTTKRSLVYGIIATGSSVGGVVFPIMLSRLFISVGFKWAVRTAGFLTLAAVVAVNIIMRPRLAPRRRGTMLEPRHFKDPVFTFFVIAMSLIIMGLYTPVFYISSYAIAKGVDPALAFYTLSILNATSILGRVVPNLFANKLGPMNILYTASVLSGILNFVWLSTSSAGSIIAFGCFYGITSGSYVATIPACLANMTANMNEIGSRTSLCFGVVSFAALCGTPITGALLKGTDFTRSACFSGAVVIVGCCFGITARYYLVKRSGTWKV